jgi:O-antigen/teichoic acid export membrane protein
MATGTGLGRQEAESSTIDAGGTPRGLRALLADSLVYGIAVAAVPAAALLATPVLARVLDPAGYGLLDVLSSLLALATVVALVGLDQAVTRGYFDHAADEVGPRRAVVRTGLTIAVAVSVGLAALLAAGGALVQVARGGDLNTERVGAVAAAILVLPLATTLTVARLPLLLERRRWSYVGIGLLQAGAGVATGVLLVVAGLGPPGYFLGLAFGAACALVLTLARTRPFGPGASWDRAQAGALLRFGVPLVPATVLIWVVFAVDRTLLVSFRDLEEAGYYGLASRVTAPLLLAVSAFGVAWSPLIMSQVRARQPELRARTLTGILAATGSILLVLVVFAEPLVRVFGGSEFAPAVRAVPPLALGWLGWAAATVLLTEFSVTRRTTAIAAVTGVAALANLVLNLALIPPFGFVGAAWATAVSFVLMALVAWAWERRLTRTPYRWGRLAAIAAVLGAAAPAALLPDTFVGHMARAAVCALAIAVLVYVAVSDRAREPR